MKHFYAFQVDQKLFNRAEYVYIYKDLFGWGMKVFWITEKGNLFRPMSWASACQPPHFQAGASKKQSGPTGGAEVGIRSGKTQVLVNYICRIYIYTYTFVCIGDEVLSGLCHAHLSLDPTSMSCALNFTHFRSFWQRSL